MTNLSPIDLVLDPAGRRILVAGAGVAGRAVAKALLSREADVTVADGKPQNATELVNAGATLLADLTEPPADTELIVTSPGWRPDTPLLVSARNLGVPVIGDVELAWHWSNQLDSPPTWLVVTGTNGKTTTTGMLESILRAAGLNVAACGNIGLPVVEALAGHPEVLAVELSSFQLYWAPSVRPAAGVLLNLAPDHLDWHGSMANYAREKAKVLTGEVAIAGTDDPVVADLLVQAPAQHKIGFTLGEPRTGQLGVRDGWLVDRAFYDDEPLLPASEVRPQGPAGISDALAATALARAYGVPYSSVVLGLQAYRPVDHRAQLVGVYGGVRYVNDSKATNPHAVKASMDAYDHGVVWIAGGLLKGASMDDLVSSIASKLAGAVLIGTDQDVIAEALARHAPDVPVRQLPLSDHSVMQVMAEAVRTAQSFAHPGGVVLLAPAGTSWDMFTDYQHRGRTFIDAVHAIAEQETMAR